MNLKDVMEQRKNFYLAPSTTVRGALVLCGLIGALTLVSGFVMSEPKRVWGAFLFNLFFFLSLGVGGIAFAAMQDVIGAVWSRPIKRVHESFAAFLPVSALLLIGFLFAVSTDFFGAGQVYSWIANPESIAHFHGKNVWLTKNFMIARDVFAILAILALAMWQLKTSVRRDVCYVQGKDSEGSALAKAGARKLRYWSAPILVVYALCFSLLAFDLLMSLAPTWYSTLWGGWLFAVMMQTLMATLLIVMFSLRQTPIGQVFRRQQFHDVGKLMHGFTIFFAYTTYAHVLTYWFGNVPEETEYFIHRLHGPWLGIVLFAPVLSFLLPLFILIFRAAKWTGAITIPICLCILFAQWLTELLIVIPEVVDANQWKLPWVEVGVFLGFLCLFASSILWFGKRYPMMGIGDPLLAHALSDHH